MKNCGFSNVRKHREIKGSDKYINLDISLKFYSLDKMRITYSESKDNLVRSGKGLITSLGHTEKARPRKYNKARYAIGNISKKDISEIIREFDKLPHKSYNSRRPKNEPTDSYFYLSRKLAKCMVRADSPNSHIYPVRKEMTDTKQIFTLHVCSTDKGKLK